MNVSEFIIVTTKESDYGTTALRPRIVCNDGFDISLQAGTSSYSSPKKTAYEYATVELGFPSDEEELINEYAEYTTDYTNTVYGHTPIELIEAVIKKHGGIDVKKTFIKDE